MYMPHIHNKPGQHDICVSGYIVKITEGDEPRIILHKHRKLKMLLQFGGHVELDETPWQAVLREIAEESGYDKNQLKLLQPCYNRLTSLPGVKLHPQPIAIHTYPAGSKHYHTDISYAFITSENPIRKIADDESDNINLFSLNELEKLASKQIYDNAKAIAVYTLTTVIEEWKEADLLFYKS